LYEVLGIGGCGLLMLVTLTILVMSIPLGMSTTTMPTTVMGLPPIE